MKRGYLSLAGLVIVLLVGSSSAMAQANLHEPSQAFSGLLELIQINSNQWSFRLQGYARSLFWLLASIDLVLIVGPLVLRNASFGEFLDALIKFVLVIGFFATLLIFSVQWSEAIVNSFRQAGATAAGVGMQLTPGAMFSLGVELAYLVGDVRTINPATAFIVALAGLVILLCYTFIAAFMALTLVESYIVINAGVLFMGFGGSKFTREHAISILRYAFSVGAKLFVLTLIVGLVMDSARQWQLAYNHDNTSMWTMVGLALVCALLSKTIPDLIQSLINGVSSGGGGSIGGMAAAAMAGGAAGAAAMHSLMSGGGLLGSAGKSVSDLLKSFGGGSGGSSGVRGMNFMGSNAPGSSGGSGGPSPRIGGGMVSSAGHTPGPAPSASAAPSNSASSSGNSASGAASNIASTSGASKSPAASSMAHAAAEMGIKTFGTASSIAVPGMEGSESLSVGPPPVPPDLGDVVESAGQTPENIIRPAGVPDGASAQSPMVDTMSSLQQALDNRGKLS